NHHPIGNHGPGVSEASSEKPHAPELALPCGLGDGDSLFVSPAVPVSVSESEPKPPRMTPAETAAMPAQVRRRRRLNAAPPVTARPIKPNESDDGSGTEAAPNVQMVPTLLAPPVKAAP